MESPDYAKHWKLNLENTSTGKNVTFIAVVVIKNPVRAEPYLESVVWTFFLGIQENKQAAEKAFEQLGFSLPSHAHVLIEEKKI